MRAALFIALVIGLGIKAFRRPDFGVMAFVGLGILNLGSYVWGIGRTFPFAQIIAICTLVGFLFYKEKWRVPRQKEAWIFLLIWGLFGLSTLSAAIPDRGIPSAIAVDRFVYISKMFLMIFFSMIVLRTKEQIFLLMKVIAVCIGFYAIKGGIFSISTGFTDIFWGPEGSFLSANTSIGLAVAMNVPFLFYYIKIEQRQWLRRLMWGMFFLSYPAVIGTFSRGAWLGLAAASGMLLLRSNHKAWLIPVGSIALLIAFPLLSSDLMPDRVAKRLDQLIHYEEEESAVSRFWNWEGCFRVGLANPVLGEGFAYYSPQTYVKYFPEFIEKYGNEKVWTCHSMWFTVWAEIGPPAFLIWILLLGLTFLSLRKISKISKMDSNFKSFGYMSSMLKMGLVVYMICGTFLDTAYFDLYYQLVAVVIMLKENLKDGPNSSGAKPKNQHLSEPGERAPVFAGSR